MQVVQRDRLIEEVFNVSDRIRYIAIYDGNVLTMKERSGVKDGSSGESDKYEELLVNPTLIKLASQRGAIDCGGLEYFVIRYGKFYVLLTPFKDGHVNFGMELDVNPILMAESLQAIVKRLSPT